MSCRSSSSTGSRQPPRHARNRASLPVMALALLTTGASLLQTVAATTGGSACPSEHMCISAIADDTKVTYQMQSQLGFQQLGWMAVGFGTQMPNSPMVITWPNSDGSITLSQREAPGHVMPTVVPNPPQLAVLSYPDSTLGGNSTNIAFDYPLPVNLETVDMIFAWATIRPPSAAVDATLEQHEESGPFVMDLTQAATSFPPAAGGFATTVVGSSTIVQAAPSSLPTSPPGAPAFVGYKGLTPQEVQIRTHGILMSVGFLIILPIGVFVARFSRTVPFLQGKWFTAHWFIQLVLAGPIITTGWVIGHRHVADNRGPDHFSDPHRRVGLILLILYCIQVIWGAVIHFFKPKGFRPGPLLPASAGAIEVPLDKVDAEKTEAEAATTAASHAHSSEKLPTGPSMALSDAHSVTSETADGTPSTVPTKKLAIAVDPLSPDYHPSSLPCHNRYPAVTARPIQNYLHAVNGLVIVGLAFHNVREGYHHEWEYVFGLRYTPFLEHINNWWIAWVIIIPCIYVIGLTLLPRQFRQEDQAMRTRRAQSGEQQVPSDTVAGLP